MKLYKCSFSGEIVVIVVALLIFVFHLFDASVAPDKRVSEPLLEPTNEILVAIAYAQKAYIEHPC